jgi:hypothetical protein
VQPFRHYSIYAEYGVPVYSKAQSVVLLAEQVAAEQMLLSAAPVAARHAVLLADWDYFPKRGMNL